MKKKDNLRLKALNLLIRLLKKYKNKQVLKSRIKSGTLMQIISLETHKTIEQLDIKSDLIRVYIDEQKTLEFYGFNKMSKINRSYFKNFYI